MTIHLMILLAPVVCALCCFCAERYGSASAPSPVRRTPIILGLALINQGLAFGLSAIALVPLVFLLAPLQIVSIASWEVPTFVSFTVSLLLLDLSKYAEHRLHHSIPLLWRVHRLHHADRQVDALTSLTHHPLEVALTFFLPVVAAVLFDIPVIAMIVYGLLLAIHGPLTHLNVILPDTLEKYLAWLIVTPNSHRIHHSVEAAQGNANFGSLFTVWDKILFTSIDLKSALLLELEFGIDSVPPPHFSRFGEVLTHPFK